MQTNPETRDALLQALLTAEAASCVVRNGDTIRIFRRRGVLDLFTLLQEEPALLSGAVVADKVVGKGAAALMILGGVRTLLAGRVSEAALALLRDSAVEVHFEEAVPQIVNRDGTGCCPVEALCRDCRTAGECLSRIAQFVEEMQQKMQQKIKK